MLLFLMIANDSLTFRAAPFNPIEDLAKCSSHNSIAKIFHGLIIVISIEKTSCKMPIENKHIQARPSSYKHVKKDT